MTSKDYNYLIKSYWINVKDEWLKWKMKKVRRGLISISMCQKRVHAFFYVKLFLQMLRRIRMLQQQNKIWIRATWVKKGRHFKIQDMRSCLLKNMLVYKNFSRYKRKEKFSVFHWWTWMFNKVFTRDQPYDRIPYATKLCYSHKSFKNRYK